MSAVDRCETAMGNGKSIYTSSLYVRRSNESRSASICARGVASETNARDDPYAGWRELCLLGRTRGLRYAAQYRLEERTGPPRHFFSYGCGLYARDRISRSVAHRAQTEGADEASIRFRCRHGDRF